MVFNGKSKQKNQIPPDFGDIWLQVTLFFTVSPYWRAISFQQENQHLFRGPLTAMFTAISTFRKLASKSAFSHCTKPFL